MGKRRHLKDFIQFKFPAITSLKVKLGFIFSGLMMVTVFFAITLLFRQHEIAGEDEALASRSYSEIVSASEAREMLAEISNSFRSGRVDYAAISRFRSELTQLQTTLLTPESVASLQSLDQGFETYAQNLAGALRSRNPVELAAVRADERNVASALNSFIEVHKASVAKIIEDFNQDRHHEMKGGLFFLIGFIILMVYFGNKMIAVITEPLSSLSRFLDNVDVEDDFPSSLPNLSSTVLEVKSVARSFERLLERLRGYRALNVKRLLIEKRRADIIASSTSDGIFLLHGEEVLYMNPKAERILGFPNSRGSRSIRLAELAELREESGASAVLNALRQTMPVEFTLVVEGRNHHYLINAFPISSKLIEEIEHSVPDSIDAALNRIQADAIVIAQDVTIVKESQDAKGHFLATLSHEVKTPVTSMTMALHLLRRSIEKMPQEYRSLILTCVSDVDRLRGLLDELLTVSKFETLTQKLDIKRINLGDLLRQSVRSFQLQAAERGVHLEFKIKSEAPNLIPVDPTKIAWALSNLLTNALRHTPKGGTVEAHMECFPERVQFKVLDTGPGIDMHRQEKIFDKFNTFYDIRVGRSGSAGVGLAVAREIIHAHGGRIWVLSEPGKGSEFCFTLPTSRVQVVADNISAQSSIQAQVEIKKEASSGS